MVTEWSQVSELCQAYLLALPRSKVNKCMFILTPQSCSAQTFYSAHTTQGCCVRVCSLNIQLITLTTGLLMGKWRTFTFKQTASPSLCMWIDKWVSCWWLDSLLALCSAARGQQGQASMVTEAKWTQPQLFAAVHSCKLHVSLSPQTEQGVAVCGFMAQLQLPAGGLVPTISWLWHAASEFIWLSKIHVNYASVRVKLCYVNIIV